MSKTTCEIVLDNPSRVYYGGQTVSGNVTLTLHKEKTVKGIYITIMGNAECLWSEHSGDKRMAYRGKECYLSTKIYFVGEEEGEPITLKPDEYVYTFSCQLPDEVPTSLQGTFGQIRYNAVVTISVPLWPDKTYEEDFTVIKTVNLNDMFELKDSISVEKRKEFYICCLLFCFKTRPLYIVAKLPATGYTPGQRIELKLEVDNQSSKIVQNFRIEFFKILIYKSNQLNSRRKTERIKLAEFLPGGCSKSSEVEYTVGIVVPSVPPTDLTASSVVRVKYEIQITADVSCCHNSPELTIPITIGSVPFIENYHRLRRRPTAPSLKARPKPLAPTDLIGENPPSYEQAVTIGMKIDNLENTYTPLYPVFRN